MRMRWPGCTRSASRATAPAAVAAPDARDLRRRQQLARHRAQARRAAAGVGRACSSICASTGAPSRASRRTRSTRAPTISPRCSILRVARDRRPQLRRQGRARDARDAHRRRCAQTWMFDASPSPNPTAAQDPTNSVARVLALMERLPKHVGEARGLRRLRCSPTATRRPRAVARDEHRARRERRARARLDLAAIRAMLDSYYATDSVVGRARSGIARHARGRDRRSLADDRRRRSRTPRARAAARACPSRRCRALASHRSTRHRGGAT